MIGQISFDTKLLGERSAGNPHATFDAAGAGNGKDGKSYMSTKLETMEIDKLRPVLHRASSRPYSKRHHPKVSVKREKTQVAAKQDIKAIR
jgi:hypothetical protein